MKFESAFSDQDPSLTLFEDLFRTLSDESKSILIHYNCDISGLQSNRVSDRDVCSVNGCSTPDEFKIRLMNMVDVSLTSFSYYIRHSDEVYRNIQIQNIRKKLWGLTAIVGEETIILHDGFGKYPHRKNFKTFKNPEFKGFDEEHQRKCGHWMLYIAEEYAEVWLEMIESAIARLDLLCEFIEKNPGEGEPKEAKVPMVKLELTVSEIGYILNLGLRAGFINVPPRKTSEFITILASNVQSKNSVFITPSSLRNKYAVPDFKALDTLKEKLGTLMDMINEDEEVMAK